MDLLTVLSWIGVFALSIGSLISLVGGGIIAGCFGILLTSLTVSTLIPLKGKLCLMLGGSARIFLLQRMGGLIGGIGSWVLVGVGGWEFVPAAVVMSLVAAWWPVMKIIERGRQGKIRQNELLRDSMGGDETAMIRNKSDEPVKILTDKNLIKSPPPQYTASTVTIIIDDPPATETAKIQTPIFNV